MVLASKSTTIEAASGVLVLYTLYYLGHGWLPATITLHRITYYVVPTGALLGLPELDLVVLAASITASILLGVGVGEIVTSLLLAFTAYTLYAFLGDPRILTLYAVASILALRSYMKRLEAWRIARAAFVILITVEALALTAATTYFVLGGWNSIAQAIVLRERYTLAPVTYASIPLLLAVGLSWLYTHLTGRDPLRRARDSILSLLSRRDQGEAQNNRLDPRILLALAPLLAALIVILPHLPTVNPTPSRVSVDTYYYLSFINYARQHGLRMALERFAGMARPAYLTLLYLASKVVDPYTLMDIIHPIIALTLLAIASYKVVEKIAGRAAAGYAAILAASGRSAATFIAGGFQANSIALPLALLTLTQKPGTVQLYTTALLIALIHPWTLAMYAAAYLLQQYKHLKNPKTLTGSTLPFITALIIAEILNQAIAHQSTTQATIHPVATTRIQPILGLARAITAWTWSSQNNPLLLLTPTLAASTPLTTPLAIATPLIIIARPVIAHRLLLNTPLEQLTATITARLPREAKTLLILAAIAATLETLTGLEPALQTIPPYQ